MECRLEIQADNSIRVSTKARLRQIEDDPWHFMEDTIVPPKVDNSEPGLPFTFDLVRSEMAWPVRAPSS